MLELMQVGAKRPEVFVLAELDGQPIATGALCIVKVALMAGASTIPEGRAGANVGPARQSPALMLPNRDAIS
jgi:hypothetical protein